MSSNNEGYKSENYCYPCYMKVGNEFVPVPVLLTEEETIQCLRLDTDDSKDHTKTLKYYRDKGLLRPTRIGKTNKYSGKEVLKFIDIMTEKTNKQKD